jgi:hypothetical protein
MTGLEQEFDDGCTGSVRDCRRLGCTPRSERESIYPSKALTMLSHSTSNGSLHTGLPARPYQ